MLLAIGSLLSLGLAHYGASRHPVARFFCCQLADGNWRWGSLIAFYLKGKERDHFLWALYQIPSLVGLGLIGAGLIIVFALQERWWGGC